MTDQADPEDLAARVAAGVFDAEALRWLQAGLATVQRAGGAVGLERALRLAATPKQRRRRQRNFWLAEVARHLVVDGDEPTARQVRDAIDRFLTRGPWRAWRDLQHPPAGAAELNACLFRFAQMNDGEGLCLRQIEVLLQLRRNSTEKLRADPVTMGAWGQVASPLEDPHHGTV